MLLQPLQALPTWRFVAPASLERYASGDIGPLMRPKQLKERAMRKAILLAMAASIVAMFAMSSSASAAWTKHHAALGAGVNVELEITGTDVAYSSDVGGVTCKTTISKVLLEGGTTTGKVKTLEPEGDITANCQGTGAIAQCEVHEATADNLPWVIHTATGTTATITTGLITNTLSGFFCPHTLELTPGTVTATVGAAELKTTSTASLSGTLVTHETGVSTRNAAVSGEVHVLGTITYGL